VIDSHGFRYNVGIILTNHARQVFWARRRGMDAWQFPQGGIQEEETPESAMYRELEEEVGLTSDDVEIIGSTRTWLRYRLPRRFVRYHQKPLCIGQRQRWYVLRLIGDDSCVCLDASNEPEFDRWRWADYWEPLEEVVAFKRKVYRRALNEFAPLLFSA
jgi:putative (di)nucleoside polyphosphate hydrolase